MVNYNVINDNDWKWVFRGRNKLHEKPIANPYSKDVERIYESFYVTNFPSYLDTKRLWQVCEPYGRIVDAYTASKKSKMGKGFGFIRFKGVVDSKEFAKGLANIWVDNFHLFVTVARFKRPGKTHSSKAVEEQYKPNSRVRIPNPSEAKLYASAVNVEEKRNTSTTQRSDLKSITLNDSDLIKVKESTKVALVKVREVGTMNAVHRLCRSEGFTEVKVHYIGGLWLWIQFQDATSCNAFRNNVAMKNVFSGIKIMTQNFVVDERMIWIEISGLPLCAWGSNAYKKVANVVGKLMFFEIDQDSSLGISRVCIATKQKNSISETVQVEVSTEEKQQELEVKVKSTHTEEKIQKIEVERKVSYMDDDQEGKSYEVETDPSCPPGFKFLKKWDMHDQQSCEYSNTNKGTKNRYKRIWVKELCYSKNVHFLGVQESKMTRLELFRLKSMWGNYAFDYACSLARGRSGGKWTNSDDTFFMINVYGPHDTQEKVLLWNTLRTFIVNHAGKYLLFGDLNEVRNESERFGSLFSRPDAQCFNSFIDETNLVEVTMGGRRYTWMNKSGTKMSKLDRFLMSNDILNEIPDLKATVLERGKSDHNPILLHVEKTDYGPYPFKFFHTPPLVAEQYVFDYYDERSLSRIRAYNSTDLEREERLKLLQECEYLDRISGMDLTQKAHSHWDIEGDENTKYFHGLINQRRRQQMVKGVMIEGVWCSDPVQLDKDTSVEEIKNAVWDCGSSKAPGPDGFSFLFFLKYWDLLKDDVVEFISSLLTSGQMPLGSNSAFNTLIPKRKLSIKL
ncbi:RNA-directed DNA polymerase, eukaryota, reverse transcriptase zinc-binding domain protein [Tanacetum coccineum]